MLCHRRGTVAKLWGSKSADRSWRYMNSTSRQRLRRPICDGASELSISGLFLAATIELTADERKKLEALHREMVESEQSQTRAEHDWRDCKYQLVVDQLGN